MSKSKEEPKTPIISEQGDLFRGWGGAKRRTGSGTTWSAMRAELLSRLEEQRTLTTRIVDKIGTDENLLRAFQRVKRNGGSPGVDGVTIAEYEQGIWPKICRISEQLKEGTYRPQAVKLVEIPKANGGVRCLSVPTIEDRIVQQSMTRELQRVYDHHFSTSSHGFRPGRGVQDAIRQASGYVSEGKVWVVDIDLKNFFDEICHERLMSRLRKAINDERLLQLIHRYLKADLMKDGLASQRIAGTPQGGPLSPLLSNIVLDELDRELEHRGLSFARYADDCNVYVRSRRSAERVLKSLTQFIEEKLKLKVNREKSGVRLCDQVKFLGYTIEQNGKVRIADLNIKRFRKRIIEKTKRNRGVSFTQVVKEVNKVIQGWGAYYRLCNTWLGVFRDLDGWTRLRLRSYRLKQCQRRYPTYRFLRSLGLDNHRAWNAVMYYTWWPMANYVPARNAMSIEWFNSQGLKSLQTIQSVKC